MARLLPLLLLTLAVAALPARSVQSPQDERSTADLLAEIQSQGDNTRPAVFEALGKKGDEEAFDALVKGAKALESYNAHYWAFRAFRHFKGEAKLAGKAVEYLERRVNEDSSNVYNAAAYAIRDLGTPAHDALERIVRRHSKAGVRQIAVGGLVEHFAGRQGPDDLELLLDNFRAPTSGKREVLVAALPRFATPRGLVLMADRLRGRDAARSTKLLIIEGVATVPEARVDKMFAGALKDDSVEIQLAAIAALRARGYTRHTRELEKLTRVEDEELRSAALVARAAIPVKAQAWVERILELARARHEDDRRVAARALAGLVALTAGEHLDVLHGMLEDDDPGVRRAAIASLGELRRKESVPILFARLANERDEVLQFLHETLLLFTGEDHGTGSGRWSSWWKAEGEGFAVPSLEVAEARRKERERRKRAAKRTTFYGLHIGENNVYFVLDASGSMNAKNEWDETRLEVVKQEVEGALKRYEDGKSFNVLFFGTKNHPWRESLTVMDPEKREEAIEFVKARDYAGGTAIYDALQRAFDDPGTEAIYLLSDGAPSGGTVDDVDGIREAVAGWNEDRGVRIHCISAGRRHPLLVNLSADTGGEFREVD